MLNSKFFLTFFSLYFFVSSSFAASGPSLIRDAEAEKFLRDLTDPIFHAAGLNEKNITIYIVNDDSINAFVSGGQNVFINTGLIRKYKTPDALIGVIAHESGHIAAGHLARAGEGAEAAEHAMLLTYLLGIGAALSGSPDAATGILLGGSQSAQRLYMKFTRTQEEAADEHAVEYLDKMQYPATGLVTLLEFFESEMIGYKGELDEYLMSHPVSKKRIDLIKARTAGKNFSDKKINHKLQPEMDRVLAKLEGFMENPDELLKKYGIRNDEISNYIKSIAHFRKGEIDQALNLLNPIIEKNSKDGFLFELKGQILFESGRIEDAIIAYNQAIKLLSLRDSSQSKIAFATAILSLKENDKDLINLAIKRLNEAKEFENENPFLFKQLAGAYSKINDQGRSLLALAEFNLLIGDKEKCRKYAREAKEKLEKSAKTELIHADDLLDLAKKDEKGNK
jgi:predicted Zn-dependent protease